MQMADFLLEIGSEELPSGPLNAAIVQLGKLLEQGLDEAGLSHGEVHTLSTPRRMSVYVSNLARATEERHEVLRGPAAEIAFDADGKPTKAGEGFARSRGVAPEELVVREEDGRSYVFCEIDTPARMASDILLELIPAIIRKLSWPRSQRWGAEHERYCRPVRWIVCLHGEDIIPVVYADVVASNTTRTHRVLGSSSAVVTHPGVYEQVLEEGYVLSQEKRRERILEGIAQIEAERKGAHVDTPASVFDEVVNLCEWPTVLVGHFDEEFLAVPHEIICESMLSHQRYFPIYDAQGELTREFVLVSNGNPAVNETVIDGNERVVRARLYDAKFFYDEDLKVPLEDMLEQLSEITFQEKLGTLRQRVDRLEALAAAVAVSAGGTQEEQELARRAAHLAKADLVSQAVVEFTSQQGVMGGYYALAAGENPRVATAIQEQYRPRFAGDEIPSDVVGKSLAMADKLDTICGMFAIDEPPTGSSDPFAVRRAAIGSIAMARTMPSLELASLVDSALAAYSAQGIKFDHDEVARQIAKFFQGRLSTIAKEEGAAPDTIEAVSATGVLNPIAFLERASALEQARSNEPELFDDLATAYARAANLADAELGSEVDVSLLGEAEKNLLDACVSGEKDVRAALEAQDFSAALSSLAQLRAPIDSFFEEVLVMDEDSKLRTNRLRLLNRFTEVFSELADIGALARKK